MIFRMRVFLYKIMGMGFESCWWIQFCNNIITAKCIFISALLLHLNRSSAMLVSVPMGFPRNPQGPCHLRLCGAL